MPDLPAAVDEELQCVVEQRGVGAVEVERVTACAHPRDVAFDGVDLAVVAEHAERLGSFPRRRRVGREALVEDPERDCQGRIEEIRIERRELVGGAERLVGHRSERERGDVCARRSLGADPRPIGAPLGVVETRSERAAEDELLDARHRRACLVAQGIRAERPGPPAAEADPFGPTGVLDRRARRVVPQEDHRQAAPRCRKERPGDREQQPGPVARPAIGGDRTAVSDTGKSLEQAVDDHA